MIPKFQESERHQLTEKVTSRELGEEKGCRSHCGLLEVDPFKFKNTTQIFSSDGQPVKVESMFVSIRLPIIFTCRKISRANQTTGN